jgi:hypothetical protein
LVAVSVDANARHHDVAHTAFTHIKVTTSLVSILTGSESLYHELCCDGSHAYLICAVNFVVVSILTIN